jgi:septal ring factor EnvC (AmiA/AmiB activator)
MLLAGLQQIDVQLGQSVLAGEPVGLMGGPPRGMKLTEPASPPVLYIELRKDNRPIDPDPWWAK